MAFSQEIENISFADLEVYLQNDEERIYIINFWATWCAPCVKELPDFEKITSDFPNDKVRVLLISLDFPKQKVSKLIPFVQKKQLKSEVLLLDEPDYNSWIDKVCEDWEGAIPATVITKGSSGHYIFIDGSTDAQELITFINSLN